MVEISKKFYKIEPPEGYLVDIDYSFAIMWPVVEEFERLLDGVKEFPDNMAIAISVLKPKIDSGRPLLRFTLVSLEMDKPDEAEAFAVLDLPDIRWPDDPEGARYG